VEKSDSFVFYRSFFEALRNVPKKHRTEIYDAVFMYVFEAHEPSFSGVPRALWELIKPQLDASQRRYEYAKRGAEYGKKGAEYGKKGGRPRKEKTPLKGDTEKTPLRGINENPLNVNVNSNVNVNDNVCVDTQTNTHTDRSDRPDIETVEAQAMVYGTQISDDEAQAFIEYNEAAGWKLEWKYALKRWLGQKKERGHPKVAARGFNNFEGRDDDSLDPYALGLFANN